MSWKDAFKYAKGAFSKGQSTSAPPADAGLPLGARIGGMVNLPANTFIRASANGSLVDMFNGKNLIITAISRVRLAEDATIYRYYFSTGDDGSSPERFLQLFKDGTGNIAEVMFCTTLTRIIPQSIEEQKAFTGEEGYGLGQKMYSLGRDELSAAGIDHLVLERAMGESSLVEYWRDIGDRNAEFIYPLNGTETRIDDSNGIKGLEQEVVFMPYARDIGDTREYLLISTEILKSKDGDASKRSIHVDLMLGLPVEVERLTIQ